jgi:DNA-binding LacI/PurR family transcriptional regulator
MLAQIVKPSLTIISQPMREIAVNAATLMLERLDSEKTSGTKIIELCPNLIKGQSVFKV